MAGVYPLPTTRSSEFLAQQRLIDSTSSAQLDILKLQTQVSTGKKLITGSDDPSAAQRILALHRLLDLQTQYKTNLNATKSYLDATDTAVADVSSLLLSIRSTAQSVVGSTATEQDRVEALQEVNQAIERLVGIGNQQFRGRSLFAGSQDISKPFQVQGDVIQYLGNSGQIQSYSDVNLLTASNASGSEVFGTNSAQVLGTADLNPSLSRSTLLSDLRGGQGIVLGKVAISDGTNTSTIDLSGAKTLGDVVDAINAAPPSGRTVSSYVTQQGLHIELNNVPGSNLSVREVSGGVTAQQLGILNATGTGDSPLVGTDVNPVLRPETLLKNILGTRSTAVLGSSGSNNNVVLEAKSSGTTPNGISVQYVNDELLRASPGLTAGAEVATFNPSATAPRAAVAFSGFNNNLRITANTLGTAYNNVTIQVVDAGNIGNTAVVNYNASTKVLQLGIDHNNQTQVQTLINQVNSQGIFTASYDTSEATDGGYIGTAVLRSTDAGVVSGSTGNSGGAANTIYVNVQQGATTANQVITALQNNPTIAAMFDIHLQQEDAPIQTLNGKGIIDVNATAISAGGSGSNLDLTSGIQIASGGKTYNVDLSAAKTVQDVLHAINTSGAGVVAEINAQGSGIDVRSISSGADFSIGENGGTTATQLGIRSFNSSTQLSSLNYGRGVSTFSGTAFTIHRNDGVEFGVDTTGLTTVGQVIDAINNNAGNTGPTANRVVARLAQYGNGIELVNDNPASTDTLAVKATFGSNVAQDLGLIPAGQTTSAVTSSSTAAAATLSFASPFQNNSSISVSAANRGTSMNGATILFQTGAVGNTATAAYNAGTKQLVVTINPGSTQANTVIAAINSTGVFSASLNTSGGSNNGTGLVGTTGTVGTLAGGTAEQLKGKDSNPLEVSGVFNSLIRLRDAIKNSDNVAIERAVNLLDQDFDRINASRADIGARGQQIQSLQTQLDDQNVQIKATLSQDEDIDIVQAYSQLASRQAAYQASLQLAARFYQQSLLNYL